MKDKFNQDLSRNVTQKTSKKKLLDDSLRLDKDEIRIKISSLRNGIKTLASEEFLQNFVDVDEMPETLDDLVNESTKKLDTDFLQYKQGKYDGYKLMCDTEKVFQELFRELGEIVEVFVYQRITEKDGVNYERT